jgi:NAD(P)-dependent dehydrogenase (short-subunit alcohol dehydrogenase family)
MIAPMEIEGRVAVVTGGARRVGRVLSLGLAEAGADVIVNHHDSPDDARDTVAAIESLGRRAIAVQADVSRKSDVERIVAAGRDYFGRLDIVVNSASLFESAPLLEIDEEAWDRVMAVNLTGPFLLSRAAVPLLAEHGGVIVNIADLSAFQTWPSYAHHSVSKAGLVHLTRVLARTLAPRVRASCIVPGTVLPPEGWTGVDNAGGRERRLVEREGRPADVLDALLYLARSDFVTGEVLFVDGGRMML